MEQFDKKYVHFMWDDELEGKEGFFADKIKFLVERVNENDTEYKGYAVKSNKCAPFGATCSPFGATCSDSTWNFFYYDPNYECKRAYAEGKQIQHELSANGWLDCKGEPDWESGDNFRIKPEERADVVKKQVTWQGYLDYLRKWASEHKELEYYGMSPVCFDEWEDNEGE